MSKRKVIATSREAYQSLDPATILDIYKKIVEGLRVIGTGSYEDIARQCKLEPVRVWKRLSELNTMGLIERTGERKKMASGRCGFVWRATNVLPRTEKAIPGPGVVDFSRALIQPNPKHSIQEKLF